MWDMHGRMLDFAVDVVFPFCSPTNLNMVIFRFCCYPLEYPCNSSKEPLAMSPQMF